MLGPEKQRTKHSHGIPGANKVNIWFVLTTTNKTKQHLLHTWLEVESGRWEEPWHLQAEGCVAAKGTCVSLSEG